MTGLLAIGSMRKSPSLLKGADHHAATTLYHTFQPPAIVVGSRRLPARRTAECTVHLREKIKAADVTRWNRTFMILCVAPGVLVHGILRGAGALSS